MKINIASLLLLLFGLVSCNTESQSYVEVNQDDHIVLIGNNLCSRMMNYGHFETALHSSYPDSMLTIRNLCDGGNTPGFRPHSSRNEPWAFEDAASFHTDKANPSGSEGHFKTEDEWISDLAPDLIIAFFGFNESYYGPDGLDNFKNELAAFIDHTLKYNYNEDGNTELVLVSPIAFEDLSDQFDLPNGIAANKNLSLYTEAMQAVTSSKSVKFVDVFNPSLKWFKSNSNYTIDGMQLNDQGYQKFARYLCQQIFGVSGNHQNEKAILESVKDKNWYWHNDFKIPNGVHVYGRRYDPFGPDNYPYEIQKIRELTANRDTAIWKVCQNESYDLSKSDELTSKLPLVTSNFKLGKYGTGKVDYLYGDAALNSIKVAEGYQIELFASEQNFEDLANPVQISFDNQGRLWVAVMPSYPHFKPGDSKPNDKLIILEDTDGDGKADKQITWADKLHIPVGFEFAPEGVYISQGTHLKLLTDTDGDDRADEEEIILSGFDDHDTHHVISAFCADPSGAIYMGEGVFLHTNVETSYGPVRATNGGFFRYAPQRKHLERTAQISIPNPWGIAFDDWGQNFFAETSGPAVQWMMPSTLSPTYGIGNPMTEDLLEDAHKVRPTSGLEFVSSRHFPDEVQGDLLINNTIGFLGTKQHEIVEDGTGYKTKHRTDLVVCSDNNFRPVDMEFAPDGSLYFIDWHNVLIGHMQHNARDPLRDHVHGRVYRITYPSRPLIKPAKIHDADISTLLNNLKLPEYRTRYRTRRELRSRSKVKVLKALDHWIKALNPSDTNYEHHRLEALWVMWGLNEVDGPYLETLLASKDHRVRSAAVRVLRYSTHQIANYLELFKLAANDPHGRVRLETIVSASWLEKAEGLELLDILKQHPLDKWSAKSYESAKEKLNPQEKTEDDHTDIELSEAEQLMKAGQAIYQKDGYCGTCHQENGKGLSASNYPPLKDSEWVTGDPDRLIKLSLKGLYGPITVAGKQYPGTVPMTPYEGLLNDQELASVLTYIRKSFGHDASEISESKVADIRKAIESKEGFYTPDELIKQHPF